MVVRDAATVMLVRDTPAGGIEVLLLQRSLHGDFVGGAHAEVLAAARAMEDVPTFLPRLVADGAGTRVLLTGDPGYDVSKR